MSAFADGIAYQPGILQTAVTDLLNQSLYRMLCVYINKFTVPFLVIHVEANAELKQLLTLSSYNQSIIDKRRLLKYNVNKYEYE